MLAFAVVGTLALLAGPGAAAPRLTNADRAAIRATHVRAEHVFAALESASEGPVAEGAVGGGTGMICHQFKGGIGTASRVTEAGHTVGVLVQANHGRRSRFAVNGVPVGKAVGFDQIPKPTPHDEGSGSIIVVSRPTLPFCPTSARGSRSARRWESRAPEAGENSSGDFVVAFATGNRPGEGPLEMVPNEEIDPLFYATIEATEEAIVNALLSAETMTGRSGTVHALPAEVLVAVVAAAGR